MSIRFNLGVRDKCEGLLVELGCSFDDDTMSSGLGNGRILECLVDKYGTLVEKVIFGNWSIICFLLFS